MPATRRLLLAFLTVVAACGLDLDEYPEFTESMSEGGTGFTDSCYGGASEGYGVGLLLGYIHCSAGYQRALPPGALLAFDLATGERTVVEGAGDPFLHPVAITLDALGETAYVADAGLEAIFAVDLASGLRRIVADAARGAGPAVSLPTGLLFDGDRLLVFRFGDAPTLAVDPETGDRAPLATGLVPPADPTSVEDPPRNRALVVEPIGA